MCADNVGHPDAQYPERWQHDFESLSEIYAFAYGQLGVIVEQSMYEKKPKEYLREKYARHLTSYRQTLSHYFTTISYERRREIRAAYREARVSNGANTE